MIDPSAIKPLTIVRGHQSNFSLIVVRPAETPTGDTVLVDLATRRYVILDWKTMRRMRFVGELRQTDDGIVVARNGLSEDNSEDIHGLTKGTLPLFHRAREAHHRARRRYANRAISGDEGW